MSGPYNKRFISKDKLETILEDLQDLLFNQYNLTPLERDIVLRIALRQEAKMTQIKDMKTNAALAKQTAEDLMNKAGLLT